jgi:hypothetical protein
MTAGAGRKHRQHSGGNFAEDRAQPAEAGARAVQQSGGNFAHDPEQRPRPVRREVIPAIAATVSDKPIDFGRGGAIFRPPARIQRFMTTWFDQNFPGRGCANAGRVSRHRAVA